MDTLEKLKRLARDEKPPEVDIAARVLAEIRNRQKTILKPLVFFAALSAMAAAAVIVATVNAWVSWTDPLVGLLISFEMVMP